MLNHMISELDQLRHYHDDGDTSAFADLVRTHAGMVFATARRITRDSALAEDVAQETFIELARRGRTITDSVSAWLYRVAQRRACDAVRADVTRKRYESCLPEDWPHDSDSTWADVEPLLDEALLELPTLQRTLIIQHFLLGLKQTDIAQSMGVNQSSVSRQITEATDSLRLRLKSRGFICGALLPVMLAEHCATAAPTSLVIALNKIGPTSSGVAAVLSTFIAMKMKLVLAVAAVLFVSAAGYNLASKDSQIEGWFATLTGTGAITERAPKPIVPEAAPAQPSGNSHWLGLAKEIWARAVKVDAEVLKNALERCRAEKDVDKQLAILHSVGIMISKAAFVRVLARPHKAARDSISGEYEYKWLTATLMAWAEESPQEAIAWGGNTERLMWAARETLVRNAEMWDAFVQTCPDHRIAAQMKHWILEAQNPDASWSEAIKAGVSNQQLVGRLESRVFFDSPELALRSLRACPKASIRRDAIFALAPRLSQKQLLQVAAKDFAANQPVANYLRVLAGDPTASFTKAIEGAYFLDATPSVQLPDGLDTRNVNLRCQAERDIYRRWMAAEPAAALMHAARDFKSWGTDLDSFMFEAMRSGSMDEEAIIEVLSTNPDGRDRALTSWYEAHTPGDPVATLEKIIHSTTLEDQVKAAQIVLRDWVYLAPLEAVSWLRSHATIEQRGELAAIIARGWMVREPEQAIAFAREQGVDLAAPYAYNMVIDYLRHASPEVGDRLLLSLADQEGYNPLIVQAGGNRFRHNPEDGIRFIAEHANGDWQQALVDSFEGVICYNFFGKTEPYAKVLNSLNLERLEPQSVAEAAGMVLTEFSRGSELRKGFDWTLKLPPPIAAATRENFVREYDASVPARNKALMTWIQTAAIGADERASLIVELNRHLKK